MISMVLQCGLPEGYFNGDQRRPTRSGSTLEVCSQWYIIQIHKYCSLLIIIYDLSMNR